MEYKHLNQYKPSNRYSDYDFTRIQKHQKKYNFKRIVYNIISYIIIGISLLAFTYIVSNNVSLFSHGSPGVLSKSNNVVLQLNTRRLAWTQKNILINS